MTGFSYSCDHKGTLHEVKGIPFLLGGAKAYQLELGTDLVVDLANGYKLPTVEKTQVLSVGDGSLYAPLEQYAYQPKPKEIPKEVVRIAWTDYKIPALTAEFWRRFYEVTVGTGYKRVTFCCTGGHGRSGTALACTLIGSGLYGAIEALKFAREKHCKHAVETKGQEEYIWWVWEKLYGQDLGKDKLRKRNDRYLDFCDKTYCASSTYSKDKYSGSTGKGVFESSKKDNWNDKWKDGTVHKLLTLDKN